MLEFSLNFAKFKCENVCYFLLFGFFELKFVKFVLLSWSVFFVSFWLFEAFLFCYKADILFFFHYGPMFFMAAYPLLCLVSLYPLASIIKPAMQMLASWNMQPIKEVDYNYKKELLFTTLGVVVAIFLALLTAVFLALPTNQDKDIFLLFALTSKYFPRIQTFLNLGGELTFFLCTYMAIIPALRINYCWIQVKYHIKICLFHLRLLNESDEQIVTDLKFCIQYHINICYILNQAVNAGRTYLLPFQVIGSFVVKSIVVFYFWFPGSFDDQYARLILIVLIVTVIGCILTYCGQKIEDVSSTIFDALINLNWYKWNESNKKLYLMLLINSQKPFKFKFSENISLNYKTGVEFVQMFYSFACVMYQLQK